MEPPHMPTPSDFGAFSGAFSGTFSGGFSGGFSGSFSGGFGAEGFEPRNGSFLQRKRGIFFWDPQLLVGCTSASNFDGWCRWFWLTWQTHQKSRSVHKCRTSHSNCIMLGDFATMDLQVQVSMAYPKTTLGPSASTSGSTVGTLSAFGLTNCRDLY